MLWLAFLVLAGSANAETLVATRTIRPHTILTQDDVRRAPQQDIDALQHESQAIGLEARVTLYAGRPIYAANLSTPALVERNQLVRMIYRKGGLMIVAEGRAMAPCPERITQLADKVARLVRLRRSAVARRKVAVVLYGFPPNAGAVGTAAYLFDYYYHLQLTLLEKSGWLVAAGVAVLAVRWAHVRFARKEAA